MYVCMYSLITFLKPYNVNHKWILSLNKKKCPFIPRQIATGAFAAIVDAFTSIAQNDDYQCVPRLLCETAGGAVGSNKILESVTNLQPLFGMLANHQGLSTTPLFLFGRAVLLGMTSKGNPSSCRYAYPQCPNDPDELVYYLNNHKGGFFRFFNNIKGKPYSGGTQNFQSYSEYQSSRTDPNNLGLYNNHKKYSRKDAYDKGNEETDVAINSNTLARIQNKPANVLNNNFIVKTKWLFPDDVQNDDDVRFVKELKFPSYDDSDTDYDFDIKNYKRKGKSIAFPDRNNDDRYATKYNKNYNESNKNNYSRYVADTKTDYVFDYVHNFYVKREKKTIKSPTDDDDIKTVYIVRGNGDPRHPEVVKLRLGQSIQ
ncbi:hypothetical protein K1T71_011998 [Dendrolimus kikuchii]|uniref:Uncharacterized protein n=1 Tax=Dendrolimus kikuchii TaxID=765133 RepID=A0ACC1CK97_9NEOP|nr:hypothetical protein K1T71_011998 [Dendrolimus kikuchii]